MNPRHEEHKIFLESDVILSGITTRIEYLKTSLALTKSLFYPRDQQPCWFYETKEIICIK